MSESKKQSKAKDQATSAQAGSVSDKQPPQAQGDQPPAQGGDQTQAAARPQLAIQAQYVKDFSFENPGAPDTFLKQAGQPNVEVSINVRAHKLENDLYESVLKIGATAKHEDKSLFVLDLSYAAIVKPIVDDEKFIRPLVMIEGPRLIFPFARALISDATRDGGYMPLTLAPFDFVALFAQSQAAARKQAEEAKANEDKPAESA